MPKNIIERYRSVLKYKPDNQDFFVPTNTQVKETYLKIKKHTALNIVYSVLATSGIRYSECLDLLRNLDKSNFIVKDNFAYYSVSKLRNTKKINNVYVPLCVFNRLNRVNNTYNSLRNKYNSKNTAFSLKYLRKWQYNFLLFNKVPEAVADFIQGRVNKSVSSNHYLAKSQQASFWYAKVADKLVKLFEVK